jgi:hypothetical protein
VRHLFGIDANLLRAAAHPHCLTPLTLKSGLTRIAARGVRPSAFAASTSRRLQCGLQLDRYTAATALRTSAIVLPGPAKLTCAGRIGVSRAMSSSRPDATSIPRPGSQMLDHHRHRIGLHRVAELHLARQRATKQGHPPGEQRPVVRKEGGRADPLGEPPLRHPPTTSSPSTEPKEATIGWTLIRSIPSSAGSGRTCRSGDRGSSLGTQTSLGTMRNESSCRIRRVSSAGSSSPGPALVASSTIR